VNILTRIRDGILTVQKWRRDRVPGALGDFYRAGETELLYRGLPVSSSSLVIDAGGYHGSWTAEMLVRYGCTVKVFEPTPELAANLRERFGQNNRVTVDEEALGGQGGVEEFTVAGLGSGATVPHAGPRIRVRKVDVADVLGAGPPRIACMKLNIEGAEYEVLDRLIETGFHDRVDCFLIQFHNFVATAPEHRQRIRSILAKTHRLVWDFPLVWERWDIATQVEKPRQNA